MLTWSQQNLSQQTTLWILAIPNGGTKFLADSQDAFWEVILCIRGAFVYKFIPPVKGPPIFIAQMDNKYGGGQIAGGPWLCRSCAVTTRFLDLGNFANLIILVRLAGFEPATYGLGNRCSIHLSYRRTRSYGLGHFRCRGNRGRIIGDVLDNSHPVLLRSVRISSRHLWILPASEFHQGLLRGSTHLPPACPSMPQTARHCFGEISMSTGTIESTFKALKFPPFRALSSPVARPAISRYPSFAAASVSAASSAEKVIDSDLISCTGNLEL
jgi:hypothetical protein